MRVSRRETREAIVRKTVCPVNRVGLSSQRRYEALQCGSYVARAIWKGSDGMASTGGEGPVRTKRGLSVSWRAIAVYALITAAGVNLRTVILAVPPVLPLIQRDLGLSHTLIGFLTSLPVLVMAAAALPAGWLASRVGGRLSVAIGLALLASGAMLRVMWSAAFPLYLFTLILSVGIAVAQTSVPVLIRQWFPHRIGLVSALYSDGLIIGEALSAGLTVPLMTHFFGRDSWPATFIFWGVIAALFAGLWLALAPPAPAMPRASRSRAGTHHASGTQSQSRRVRSWQLGVVLGSGSLVYFGVNGWVAPYNQALRHAGQTPLTLLVLNSAQLPVSLGMTAFAQRLAGRRWPFVTAGGVCLISMIGWLVAPTILEPFWAALLGGSSAFVFVLGIALPALLAGRGEVARLTAVTLTLSYGVAFLGPLCGGGLWDVFGRPELAFAPVVCAGLALVIFGALLPPRSAFGILNEIAETEESRSLPASAGDPQSPIALDPVQ